ncbi:MAG: AAA family ATPase [Rhodothermaceae bacterium]|nr:AAA family ATPase [Rhodothermaceae bacterium]MYD57942.1 AAA family ATPase [Rhodothermaceae bacterium]MYJ57039.1 AAA family ATPase [Rhodothermaceae bacterium]
MTESLVFKEVRIERMYGLPFDLYLSELSPHLNIVFGPNGSGKTTIANALNGLLLPSTGRAVKLYGQANLGFGSQTLYLDVKGTRAECRINARTVDQSELSQFLRPKSYHLSLQELLPEKNDDNDLAREIIKQANGGFDIVAAGKKLGFNLQKRYNKTNEAKEFESISKKLRSVVQEQNSLQQQKNQRQNVIHELGLSLEAGRRAELIAKIIQWRSAEAEYQKAHADAESYPRVIRSSQNLTDAVKNAQELTRSIDRLKGEADEGLRTIERVQKNLEGNRLSPDGLEPGALQLLITQVRDFSEKSRKLEELKETHQAAEKQAMDAWKRLGGLLPEGWQPVFTRENLAQLQSYAKNLGLHTQEKQALEKLKILLGADHTTHQDADGNRLRDAQRDILQWILALREESPQRKRILSILLGATFASVLMSVGLGIAIHPGGFLGLIISLLIGWAYTLVRSEHQPQISSPQKDNIKRYLPELPDNPDPDTLQAGLDQLTEQRSQVQLDMLKLNESSRIERSLESMSVQQSKLEAQNEELINRINIDPPNDVISLIELVGSILSWQEFDDKARELTNRCEQVSETYRTLAETVGNTFEQYGYEKPVNPNDAERLLDIIRNDDDAAKRDHARLTQEKRGAETTQRNLELHESQYAKLFDDLELEVGDLSGLAASARQFSEWEEANSRRNNLKVRANTLRPSSEDLREHESLLELENIEDELASAQKIAAQARELQDHLTRLDAEIERTEKGRSLENALVEKENKRVELENVRNRKAARAVGQAILDTLRDSAISNAPPVFQRAQENFERVTDSRYTLGIPEDNTFRARDHQLDRDFDLTKLSSATRVQLLLSVRLAFVETQETNYRLPLTLDETLANSDDPRAQAIIKTMSTLAANRQVFYFTAQEDEVNKWKDYVPADLLHVHNIG